MVCGLSPTTPVIADADTGYATRGFFFLPIILTRVILTALVGLLWLLALSSNMRVLV